MAGAENVWEVGRESPRENGKSMLRYNQRFKSPFSPAEAARRLSEGLKGRGLLGIRMRMKVGFYGKSTPDSVVVFRVGYMVLGMMASCFHGRFTPDPDGSALEGRFGLHWKAWFIPGVIAGVFLVAISLGDPFGLLDYFGALIGILVGNLGVWYLIHATDILPGRRKIAAFIEERIGGATPVAETATRQAGGDMTSHEGISDPLRL